MGQGPGASGAWRVIWANVVGRGFRVKPREAASYWGRLASWVGEVVSYWLTVGILVRESSLLFMKLGLLHGGGCLLVLKIVS